MTLLDSFAENLNVAVIGAAGGIGSALVHCLKADERVARVHALTRSAGYPEDGKIWYGPIDITEEATIRNAAERAAAIEPLDLVIVASGLLHRPADLQPEKSMQQFDARRIGEVFAVNAIGPAIVAKHFLGKMRRDHKSVFAALSARLGSIADNRLGGWASYRASKAALNMLLKTVAIEQRRHRPESIVAALHPGTVDTRLSRPFQSGVRPGRRLAPDVAAQYLLSVVNQLTARDTGGFFAWDGKAIEY